MNEDQLPVLFKHDWIEIPVGRIRLKLRRDGTGFYEREGAPGARVIHENFLYKLEGDQLHLKLAHAREWTQVGTELREGIAAEGQRIGRWQLHLERDPYAWVMEEADTSTLVLASDSGAALLE